MSHVLCYQEMVDEDHVAFKKGRLMKAGMHSQTNWILWSNSLSSQPSLFQFCQRSFSLRGGFVSPVIQTLLGSLQSWYTSAISLRRIPSNFFVFIGQSIRSDLLPRQRTKQRKDLYGQISRLNGERWFVFLILCASQGFTSSANPT
jgi:hypothetical protein